MVHIDIDVFCLDINLDQPEFKNKPMIVACNGAH